jgi:hypothetical protein
VSIIHISAGTRETSVWEYVEAVSSASLYDILPFLKYAALIWPNHLMSMCIPLTSMRGSTRDCFYHNLESLLTILSRFLLSKLIAMAWVETAYTFGKGRARHDEIHKCLLKWAEWALNLDSSRLTADFANVPTAIAITYELLGLVIERSNDIVSLFKVLENIRIDA